MDTLERSVARFVLVDGGTAPSFTSDRLQTAIVRGGSGTFASVTENELIVNSLAGDAKSHEAENSDKTDVEILLPETALPSSEMAVTVYRQYNSSGLFAGFDRSSLNQTLVGDLTAADSELLVNSRVVSASVYFSSEATEVKNLSGNITFRFRRIDDLVSEELAMAVYALAMHCVFISSDDHDRNSCSFTIRNTTFNALITVLRDAQCS